MKSRNQQHVKMVNVNVDQMIEVILSDDNFQKLVMKRVKSKMKKSSISDESALLSLIDRSIDQAMDEVQVVEIVRSLVRQAKTKSKPTPTVSNTYQSNSEHITTEAAAAEEESEGDEGFRPSFSITEPTPITLTSPKRILKSLNKTTRPAEQPSQLANTNTLSIEIEEPIAQPSHNMSTLSILSIAPSEASTVRMGAGGG
ncbi:hypothetical protein EON65_47070, partial [archaeon]